MTGLPLHCGSRSYFQCTVGRCARSCCTRNRCAPALDNPWRCGPSWSSCSMRLPGGKKKIYYTILSSIFHEEKVFSTDHIYEHCLYPFNELFWQVSLSTLLSLYAHMCHILKIFKNKNFISKHCPPPFFLHRYLISKSLTRPTGSFLFQKLQQNKGTKERRRRKKKSNYQQKGEGGTEGERGRGRIFRWGCWG